jgi:hypothetical protein
MKRLFMAAVLLWGLVGCIPVSTLRDPRPAQGTQFTVGGSLAFSPGAEGGAAAVPLVAIARGDGQTEINATAQLFGGRLGLKQRLANDLSLDLGVTLPLILPTNSNEWPIALDVGIIAGLGPVYISPRVLWMGSSSDSLGAQFSIGYATQGFIFEFSATGNGDFDSSILAFSGGIRF